MFRSALITLGLLLATPALAGSTTSGPSMGHAPPASHSEKATAYLEASVKMEVDAMEALVSAMGKVIEKKGAEVPDDAKQAHITAKGHYDQAKQLAAEKKFGEAYGKLREAWKAHRPATELFWDKADGETLKTIGKKLAGMINKRLSNIDSHVNTTNAPADAKKQYADAKAKYAAAKTSYDAGEGREAFKMMLEAVRTLDDCLHTTWKAAA